VFSFSEAITNTAISIGDSAGAGAVSIQTNIDFGGRFQLPKETAGLFVLPVAPVSTNQKLLGLLLTADVPQSKK